MHLLLVAACMLVFVSSAGAQALKLGYVDSQKIFEGLPEARDAQDQLDARLQVWQDSLDLLSKEYLAEFEAYQSQQGMMSESAKEQKQQELLQLQQVVQEYRNAKFGQTGDAARLRQAVLAPLQDKVLKAIRDVAREEGLNFVFDKIEDATLLLYAEEKFDYTFKVLDKLKRGSK